MAQSSNNVNLFEFRQNLAAEIENFKAGIFDLINEELADAPEDERDDSRPRERGARKNQDGNGGSGSEEPRSLQLLNVVAARFANFSRLIDTKCNDFEMRLRSLTATPPAEQPPPPAAPQRDGHEDESEMVSQAGEDEATPAEPRLQSSPSDKRAGTPQVNDDVRAGMFNDVPNVPTASAEHCP